MRLHTASAFLIIKILCRAKALKYHSIIKILCQTTEQGKKICLISDVCVRKSCIRDFLWKRKEDTEEEHVLW